MKSQYESMTFQIVHSGQLSSGLIRDDGNSSEARLSPFPSYVPVGSGLDHERDK